MRRIILALVLVSACTAKAPKEAYSPTPRTRLDSVLAGRREPEAIGVPAAVVGDTTSKARIELYVSAQCAECAMARGRLEKLVAGKPVLLIVYDIGVGDNQSRERFYAPAKIKLPVFIRRQIGDSIAPQEQSQLDGKMAMMAGRVPDAILEQFVAGKVYTGPSQRFMPKHLEEVTVQKITPTPGHPETREIIRKVNGKVVSREPVGSKMGEKP